MSSTTTTKEWSMPAQRTVEGQQKGPSERAETVRVERREQDVRILTPSFKTPNIGQHAQPISPGVTTSVRTVSGPGGDYRVEERQEHYKLNIIDPKVSSHAYIPAATLPKVERRPVKTPDFPSAHSKRSFLKLQPLEQRRIRSVETRPVTTGSYLTESIERHRAMLASPLKEEIKLDERDVNRRWDKPDRPGCMQPSEDVHSTIRSETIIQSQKSLPKVTPPPRNSELERLGRLRTELEARARSLEDDYRGRPPEVHKADAPKDHDHPPVVTRTVREENESWTRNVSTLSPRTPPPPPPPPQTQHIRSASNELNAESAATWAFSSQSFSPRSVVSVNGGAKDERGPLRVRTDLSPQRQSQPKSIMKSASVGTGAAAGVGVTEQIQQVEETKRTEEIERRIHRKKEKKRGHRQHREHRERQWSPQGGGFYDVEMDHQGQWRGNGYSDERYQRQVTTKRQSGADSSTQRTRSLGQHGRPASVTDSLRRRQATYLPNGDIRVAHSTTNTGHRSSGRHRVTKSRSSRDVYHNELAADDFYGGSPIVEFPPTLPRGKAYAGGGHHDSSMSRHSRHSANLSGGGELRKTRSFADWERDANREMSIAPRWEGSYMTELERDFRDSLLMPLPDQGAKVDEREFREEAIPGGGHESLLKEVHAHSGRKAAPTGYGPNAVTDYSEAKQEFHYKKESGPGGDRRR